MTANDAPARDERNGDRRRLHAALAIALFAATLAVFWQVRRFEFVNVDDPQYITENPHVRGGLTARDIAWAFGATKASNWHPLTWLSHMADEQLYGLHAGGHHLTSAIIHALNAALLYLALLGLTRANWKSFFVAALFALHPLRMESVAWVSERKDVLCGLFFVLALWTYTKFARSENRARARRHWSAATTPRRSC